MNTKKEVAKFLDKNPNATIEELCDAFPKAKKKSLWNYSGQWKKEKGLPKESSSDSIRHKVFAYLNQNTGASLKDLRNAFPDANQTSISNYRYQWKKTQNKQEKKTSVKEQVFSILNQNPDASFRELREALPNVNPSSVSAYHSLWKNSQEKGKEPKLRKKTTKAPPIATPAPVGRKPKAVEPLTSEQELIEALRGTIEAQRGTIEAMKNQNALLRDKRPGIFEELDDMSEKELAEIKQIMTTYIKGLRKL